MKLAFKVCCFFLIGFTQVQQSSAQLNYAVESIPKALQSRANAVLRDQQWVVEMRAADDVILHVRQVLTIMNKSGEDYARLVLFYDKNTAIKSIKGELYDEFGNILSKIGQNDFQDESAVSRFSLFEDSRVKHFLPQVQQYPFTLVYEYELKFKQNLIIPDWVANSYRDMAVESASYELICKPTEEMRFKEYNYAGKRQEIIDDKGWKHFNWTVSNLKAEKIEPLAPLPDTYQTRVKASPVNFTYYKKDGEYRNWEELGTWIYQALIKPQQVPSPDMITKVKELIQDASDDREKIKTLYHYLQQKTRYVSVQIGVGGFQPMSAMEVDRLAYGDCKGLVNYMQTLLAIAGIPSQYCVVYGSRQKKSLETDFASMNQGNHVILAVPLPKDTIWLECTSNVTPFGFLGDFTDDRLVLACAAEGGKLLHTPKLSAADNRQLRSAKFLLNKGGDVVGTVQTSFTGTQYDNHLWVKEASPSERAKLLKEAYAIDYINFDSIRYWQDAQEACLMHEDIALHISRYAPLNNKRMYLLPNLFNRQVAAPDLQKRILPLYLNRGYTDEDELTFELPEHFTVEAKPKAVKLNTEFGNFESYLQEKNGRLVYYRKLVLFEGQFSPEKYQGYVDFISEIRNSDYSKVILKEE